MTVHQKSLQETSQDVNCPKDCGLMLNKHLSFIVEWKLWQLQRLFVLAECATVSSIERNPDFKSKSPLLAVVAVGRIAAEIVSVTP